MKKQSPPQEIDSPVLRILDRLRPEKPGFAALEEPLHQAVRESVGLENFGDDGYLEGMRVLLEAYDREAKLTPYGRSMAELQILGILENRLRAQKSWCDDPGILDLEIRRPIFILGLPRTGTTALHFLLGQDPGIQILEYWLAAAPQPRPPRSEWESHPDFQRAAAEIAAMYEMDPSLKAMHVMTADGPEECRHLMQQNFSEDTFDCNATIPSYTAWYRDNDMLATYRRHRDLLKLIGSRQPERRWVLKYPVHMRKLRSLLEIYPDACIVQTHRDPAKVIPSVCSVIAGWRALYEEDVDRSAIGQWQVDLLSTGMEHAMEARRERDPAQFIDLHFHDFLSDPIGCVKRVYDHFDLELSDEAERRLRGWQAGNPKDKYGEHRYTLGDFGLRYEDVAERFARYAERFGVEREMTA